MDSATLSYCSWYKEDLNATPSVFVLQPISSRFPRYFDVRITEEKKKAKAQWWDTQVRLHGIIAEAAKNTFSHDKCLKYIQSGK